MPNPPKNIDAIKMHHYTGLRHAMTALKALHDTKKQDGTLNNLTGDEAFKLMKDELHKVMIEMRKLG